jgi:hypothetical protein
MFSVRETPWHGLGAVLEEPPATVAEAIEASGLGWSVAKEPIAVDRGDEPSDDLWLPRCEEIPGFFATVRQDTRDVLGIVGERYRIVQNREAFNFIDQLLGSSINFETTGSLHGGRRVWVLATASSECRAGDHGAWSRAARRGLGTTSTRGCRPLTAGPARLQAVSGPDAPRAGARCSSPPARDRASP